MRYCSTRRERWPILLRKTLPIEPFFVWKVELLKLRLQFFWITVRGTSTNFFDKNIKFPVSCWFAASFTIKKNYHYMKIYLLREWGSLYNLLPIEFCYPRAISFGTFSSTFYPPSYLWSREAFFFDLVKNVLLLLD